ncbi:amino acid transporter [Paramarasmius palmivorus]|uniref:Amino acid transporter n=1 Tax=Paramarasmius palmivorus TaxID=297713 RepID=A0AAW0DTM3_9AGAR
MDPEKLKQSDSSLRSSSLEADEVYNEELHEPPKEEALHRGLKARQVSMIALGGAVGTGLVIGSGTALQRGGPLGLLLGYAFMGFVCYLVMVSLGEMAAYLPHKKGFSGYATRFVDPAMGFALGWNYLMKYLINAAGVVVQYWTQKVHIAVWMVIFIAFIFVVNLLGVRVFGELEFWFSSIKVVALIGLILMGIIIDLGGNPQHDRIGFRYWNPPNGPMGHYLLDTVKDNSVSVFIGFWSVLTNALFAYMGTELIGVTVGEAENPRRNIPMAIRQTFFRILVFYVGGVFVIGLVVPSTDEQLFVATKSKTGAAASPFVVATTLVGIRVLNHIINAAILLFVMSAANSDLYIGSRTLYGLAVEGKAPRIFRRVNRLGVPWPALIFCTLFCGLVFLNVKKSGAQGKSRDSLPYKAPFQPWGSWFAMIATAIITFFKGFDAFIGKFKVDTFVTSYIAIPTFVVMYIGYKVFRKTTVHPISEVDLVTGLKEIDEEERRYLAQHKAEAEARGPRTRWQKIWDNM